jgi:DNA-binding XRE family transcriptional regulator
MKQRHLARKVGISETTLSQLIRGKTLPTLEVAYKIARELDKSVEDVWPVDEEEPPK